MFFLFVGELFSNSHWSDALTIGMQMKLKSNVRTDFVRIRSMHCVDFYVCQPLNLSHGMQTFSPYFLSSAVM